MKVRVTFCVSVLILSMLLAGGCVSRAEFDKLSLRNSIQQDRIDKLLAQQDSQRSEAERWKQRCQLMENRLGLNQKNLDALEAALKSKQSLISQLTEQLGKTALPEELSNALADWAAQSGSDLVTYDEKTGIVRFKSDLLFDKGSDSVQDNARQTLESLSAILNSAAAEGFDIVIVGHTDDIPIRKPDTKAKHPTNWHLSAHRAISVEMILSGSGINETRMAVMGLGEFRPIEPNQPNKRGNPKNRRVELYIVPAGHIRIAAQVETSDATDK